MAVVGAGSSGVQIVANVQTHVEHLYTGFARPFGSQLVFAQTWVGEDGANFEHTPEQLIQSRR